MSPTLHEHLLAEHRGFDRLLERAIAAARGGDAAAATARWIEVEAALLEHLHLEDTFVLPGLSRSAPRSARVIAEEHRHLRSRLQEIGALGGALQAASIGDFRDELAAHTRSEERLIYRFVDDGLREPEQSELLAVLAVRPR